eukprot:3826648-Prymnesium_polylepis.1
MDQIAGDTCTCCSSSLRATCQACQRRAHERAARARAQRARPHLRRPRQPCVRAVESHSMLLTVAVPHGRLLARRHVEARCCAPAQGLPRGCRDAWGARPWSGGVHVNVL